MSSVYSELIYERAVNGKSYEYILGFIEKGIKVYCLSEFLERGNLKHE